MGIETMGISQDWHCSINTSEERWYGRWVLKDNLFVTIINRDFGLLTTVYYYEFINNDSTLLLTKTKGGSADTFTKQ